MSLQPELPTGSGTGHDTPPPEGTARAGTPGAPWAAGPAAPQRGPRAAPSGAPLGTTLGTSLGTSLVVMVLVALLPVLLFGSGVAWLVVKQQREAVAAELTSTARALQVAVDRALDTHLSAMQVLAGDVQLDAGLATGDLRPFEERLRRVRETQKHWFNAVLIDPKTHLIVASGLPMQGHPPRTVSPDQVDEVARNRQPLVVGLLPKVAMIGHPVVQMLAPVVRDGEVRYVLSAVMDPWPMSRLFADQGLSPTWTGAVLDKQLRLAGRSRDAEHLLGKPATPSLASRILSSERGLFTALNQEGQAVYTAFSRSDSTGWTVAIGIPAAEVEASSRTLLWQLAAAAAVLMALAGVSTVWLGRAIVRRRNAYEQALQESQAQLELALTGAHMATWDWHVPSSQVVFRGRGAEMLGRTPGRPPPTLADALNLVHPEDQTLLRELVCSSGLPDKPLWEKTVRVRHEAGHWVWVLCRGQVVAWQDDGRPLRAVGTMVDVSERHQVADELARHREHLELLVVQRTAELGAARDAAEAANRAKSAFLANMSHELRTPLSGVMGLTELALRRATDPRQIEQLNKSLAAARHLLQVIGNILDFSRIEADKLRLDLRRFDLATLIDQAWDLQDGAAKAKGLQFERQVSHALPAWLMGDALRIKQILVNYLANAVKFSHQGQIKVVAMLESEDDSGLLLRLEVHDQGIGISPEVQSGLFKPFTQADDSSSRPYGGSGLGLSICKGLAQRMGGDAGMVSAPGQGSCFWVTARLQRAVAPLATDPQPGG